MYSIQISNMNNAETTESVTSKLTINYFRDCLYKKIKLQLVINDFRDCL